ncbi:MAG: site-specific DNA-methyltransferase [candidate division Zixibacteria bacterium]|nr:site-specific DNA-methyltransferase [candidate division Zixibacteria bacterium]
MAATRFTKLDLTNPQLREKLLPHCRLKLGEIWSDPNGRHAVGCGDATDRVFVRTIMQKRLAALLAQDPPYNVAMFKRRTVAEYIEWCRQWVDTSTDVMSDDATMYIWMGADQKNHFQPLPEFMLMMAKTDFESKSLVTLRNQRGYGTQKNWMAVRQELLSYTRGKPGFNVQYTDIPKILRGYYKEVDGVVTENIERGRSDCIRPGNVWVDVQQVFYRMEENVSGCAAQKPLKAIERIVLASSGEGDVVADFFAHAGTTLLACERLGRRCVTLDIDPIYAEIAIRRMEHFRKTGKSGWQMGHPFEKELHKTDDAMSLSSL